MLCAIHQPNFFPWLGYFNKIAKADAFVFLNHVDYEKSGHSMQCYTNRVAIADSTNEIKIHCPVVREHGPQKIDSIKIKTDEKWRDDIYDKIEKCYGKALFWEDLRNVINELLSYQTDSLSDFNINAIKALSDLFGFSTSFYYQDQFISDKHSTELLAELVKWTGCDRYLYGKGGSNYQDDHVFQQAGIEAIAQDYVPFNYERGEDGHFIPGLSVLDAIGWIGIKETAARLKGF